MSTCATAKAPQAKSWDLMPATMPDDRAKRPGPYVLDPHCDVTVLLRHMCDRARDLNKTAGYAAVFDLDHVRWLNDQFGASAGTTACAGFAQIVWQGLRPCDGFRRIGGPCVLSILMTPNLEEAGATTSAIVKSVRDARLVPGAPTYALTCSAGLTGIRPGQDSAAVWAKAHAALAQAKIQGRDQLTLL